MIVISLSVTQKLLKQWVFIKNETMPIHSMKYTKLAFLALLPLFFSCQSGGEKVVLFDGQSLEGWEGNPDFFRVEDGAIVAGRLLAAIPQNEFLCTEQEYADFELTLKAKLVGPGENGGVQFRSRRVENSSEMYGYQADIGYINAGWIQGFEHVADKAKGMEADARFPLWAALYDESRRRIPLAVAAPDKVMQHLKEGDWNALRVRAEGKRIRIWLNDELMTDYEEAEDVAQSGKIGLQVHSGPPLEVWYKDIFIEEL